MKRVRAGLALASLASVASALLGLVVEGCSTSSGPAVAPPSQDCSSLTVPGACPSPPPSWSKDVQPFVEAYCLQCHGTGGIASAKFPLATYADVKTHATQAWQQVSGCLMPNTDASPPPLAFPTPAQRETFVTWAAACGAPEN